MVSMGMSFENRLSLRSLTATATFMGAGFATVFFMRHVLSF